MRFGAVLAVLFSVGWTPSIGHAVGLPISTPATTKGLAAQRALYTLTLDRAPGGDIVAAQGRMSYEMMDACSGWAIRQRMNIDATNTDGHTVKMVSDYATWESMDGLKFRFHMMETTNGAVTTQIDGYASLERPGGPGMVHYRSPKPKVVKLPPGTLFPTMQTAALIAGAQEGKRFMAMPLFDGTDDNGAEDSSIVVIDWKKPFPTQWPALSVLPSTRVRIAFFGRKPGTMLPNYEEGIRYWENGVADNIQMDFGDFVMDGKMIQFHLLPRKC